MCDITLGKSVDAGNKFKGFFRVHTLIVECVHDSLCLVGQWAAGDNEDIGGCTKCCFF